ncbi:MAG: D-alanyl-D-alanine carboxypeptidase family protein [Actinobacteria bacterium]|nr:D-alanyl-D-alanine carboxypeptidase family protein [Actinomycetota bacterium]
MGKSRPFLAFFVAFFSISGVSYAAESVPLSCANKKDYVIRISTVIKGCTKTEYSLGPGAINHPSIRPKALDKQITYRFKAAQAAAKKDGQILYITSGFRTLAHQDELFSEAIEKYGTAALAGKWVAPPLLSHHPWGIAIDVNYPNDPKGAGWLERNGSKFGLCRIYKNEWWHFEPAIAPGATCPALVKDATFTLD